VWHGELSAGEAVKGAGSLFLGNVSPIDVVGSWEQMLPTALTPLAETFIEKRNYMGVPLVGKVYDRKADEDTPYHLRGVRTDQLPVWQWAADLLAGSTPTGKRSYMDGKTATPREAKGIADLSPDQIQHLILSYLGGLGIAANDVANLAYTLATGGDVSPNKVPIASGFYSEVKPRYYTERYYRIKKVYDQIKDNIGYDIKTGRIAEYSSNPNLRKLLDAQGSLDAGTLYIDAAREKSLRQAFEIWDAAEHRMGKASLASRSKSKEEVSREVEKIAKETVRKVAPVLKELGIAY
jgi:hypothetical protein